MYLENYRFRPGYYYAIKKRVITGIPHRKKEYLLRRKRG